MEKLNRILTGVLGIDEKLITDATSPDSVATWDSFNGLLLVSELENSFNVQFTTDEIASVKCVGDIKAALKRHGVDLH